MSGKIVTKEEYESEEPADDVSADKRQFSEEPEDETPDMLETTGALTPDGEAGVKPPPTPEEEDALCATWKGFRDGVDMAQGEFAFWTEALTGDTLLIRLLEKWQTRIEKLTRELKPLGQKMDEIRDNQAHILALEENIADVRAQLTNAERTLKDRRDSLAVFERSNKALVEKWGASSGDWLLDAVDAQLARDSTTTPATEQD
jgi:hypothetical protein